MFAFLKGGAVDRAPAMPITMMFAARQAGVKYGEYVRDHRVMVEAQILTAERFGIDQVSGISDPTREACELGAKVQFFEDQPPSIVEHEAMLEDKGKLARLKQPDPLGGGRMTDRVAAMALYKERVGPEKVVQGWRSGGRDWIRRGRGM